jgi:hypothetical protein
MFNSSAKSVLSLGARHTSPPPSVIDLTRKLSEKMVHFQGNHFRRDRRDQLQATD